MFKACNLCEEKHYALGYCRKHYVRFKKHGDATVTLKAPPGTAERYVGKDGYVRVCQQYDHPNSFDHGKIFEHVLVMSRGLGRPLVKGENVHHKNGDRSDNRLENLELWSKTQPAGQRVDDKVQWARELLALYGTDEEKEKYGGQEKYSSGGT